MKKLTFVKLSIVFLIFTSFHLFSTPHFVEDSHHFKSIADQGSHNFKANQQTVDDEDKFTGDIISIAVIYLMVTLSVAEVIRTFSFNRLDRLKRFLIARYYQSSYFDKIHV